MSFIIHWEPDAFGIAAVTEIDTPAGRLRVRSRGGVIMECDWAPESLPESGQAPDIGLKRHLERYWLNTGQAVGVRLLRQGTAFQRRVWAALSAIPAGATLTYARLAETVGSSPRAVGNACRNNPFPLLIPCHRVVSASGLGGYNGYLEGEYIAIKRNLLAFESKTREGGTRA